MTDQLLFQGIALELERYAYRYASEHELHDGIARVLDFMRLPYEREFAISSTDRFDFWLPAQGFVIEAKIKGSLPTALIQCARYAGLVEVNGVLLATPRFWATGVTATHVGGTPIRTVKLRGAAF